jgi:hypothetical protein
MALRFTDLSGKSLFEFNKKEYPESLPWDIKVKLNKIEYPDDHYTNQIIGAKLGEINFSGKFYGGYFDGLGAVTAKERSDEIEKLIKKVVVINYAIGGFAGYKSTVVIEEYNRKIINYYEVEYELKLVPHEPQTRVKPDRVANVSIASDGDSLLNITQKASNALNKAQSKAQARSTTAKPPTSKPATSPSGKAYTVKLTTVTEAVAKAYLRARGKK